MPQSPSLPNLIDIHRETVKNRLVLIGNGFDLALGNKTSYNHFLMWFLKKQLGYSVKNGRHIVHDRSVAGFSEHNLLDVIITSKYGILITKRK